jgi:hypothetical protein
MQHASVRSGVLTHNSSQRNSSLARNEARASWRVGESQLVRIAFRKLPKRVTSCEFSCTRYGSQIEPAKQALCAKLFQHEHLTGTDCSARLAACREFPTCVNSFWKKLQIMWQYELSAIKQRKLRTTSCESHCTHAGVAKLANQAHCACPRGLSVRIKHFVQNCSSRNISPARIAAPA